MDRTEEVLIEAVRTAREVRVGAGCPASIVSAEVLARVRVALTSAGGAGQRSAAA